MLDTFALSRTMREQGVDAATSDAVATAIGEAMRDHAVTPAELDNVLTKWARRVILSVTGLVACINGLFLAASRLF